MIKKLGKEIVIVMGYPCAGKSTLVKEYVSQGYVRLNRDDEESSLAKLHAKLEDLIKEGANTQFVLDNTYGKKTQREPLITIAKNYKFKITCVWLKTRIEDAQFNSSWRILEEFGLNIAAPHELLGPEGSKRFQSANHVPVIALFAYKKSFEPPTKEEGFDSIEKVDFERKFKRDFTNKAIFLDYDGTLRELAGTLKYPTDPTEVKLLPNRKEILKKWQDDGYLLIGVSNQSGVEKGKITEVAANQCFEKTNDLLGLDIDYEYCPHHSFPIRCYCRKPLPGLAVHFIRKHKLNPAKCIMVGDSTSDATFAKRSGMQFQWADDFFKDPQITEKTMEKQS